MTQFVLTYRGKDYLHTEKSIMRALPAILVNMALGDEVKIAIDKNVSDASVIMPAIVSVLGKVTG